MKPPDIALTEMQMTPLKIDQLFNWISASNFLILIIHFKSTINYLLVGDKGI